jgi:polyphosphate kinase 2 (PPK2 family)
MSRIKDPARNWKYNPADFDERKYWDDYMRAYADALSRCSTPWAPWYVIPADHKWYRNLAVASIIVDTMKRLEMKFPKPTFDLSRFKIR